MTAPPYMRWYPSDYLGDTTHLNREEHGAYFLLLQACWLRGGKLIDDDQVLATITLCTHGEWPSLRQKLAPFFKISRGVWRQKRLSRELNDALRLRRQQSIGGQKTAAKRWTNNNKTRNSSASSTATSSASSTAISYPYSSANSTATATPAPAPAPVDSSSLRSVESKSRPSAGAANRAAAPEDEKILQKGEALLGHRKRGLIRRMLTRYGEDRVRDALAAVERKQPAAPSAYFAACCEKPTADYRPPEPPQEDRDAARKAGWEEFRRQLDAEA